MKYTLLALLAVCSIARAGNYGGANYTWGHVDRFGNYYNFDTNGNYSFGRVDPQTGNYWGLDTNGNYSQGQIWQDPD